MQHSTSDAQKLFEDLLAGSRHDESTHCEHTGIEPSTSDCLECDMVQPKKSPATSAEETKIPLDQDKEIATLLKYFLKKEFSNIRHITAATKHSFGQTKSDLPPPVRYLRPVRKSGMKIAE
jgi:hypothetical protein